MRYIFFIAVAYLLGSIPFGYLVARFWGGVDIREHGSGNIGATNVFRTMGFFKGLITLLLDALKGIVPVMLAKAFLPHNYLMQILTGFSAIAGHTYSIFMNFKGGKGVATAAGVFAALLPGPTIASIIIFGVIFIVSGYVSVASLSASVALPLAALLYRKPFILVIFALAVAVLIFYKHSSNIKRIREGKETKFNVWEYLTSLRHL